MKDIMPMGTADYKEIPKQTSAPPALSPDSILQRNVTPASAPAEDTLDIPSDVTPREKRNRILKEHDIKYEDVHRTWFTLSHLLPTRGDHIVNMGCGDGTQTFIMAALRPDLKFTGLDINRRLINQAKTRFALPNLEYKIGDASAAIFPKNSIDSIINSSVLHVIYSGSQYNEQIVNETLETQFSMLKDGGTMLIRDYACRPPEAFVQMEFPDIKSHGESVSELSEADLLLWYAEHARPKENSECRGFFLEELPPLRPHKRLFRLPYKWAYEFMLRKDDREQWEKELPMEYMFFTPKAYRKALQDLGARVLYSAPHWNEQYIAENFEGKFRLYADDGRALGYPPTSFIALAQKKRSLTSLVVSERRPSNGNDNPTLSISGMRDTKSGHIIDVVRRDLSVAEVIPYHVTDEGVLKIYLHEGVVRSVAGAVPRRGANIDGKEWSGHMVEQIAVKTEVIDNILEDEGKFDIKNTAKFMKTHIGLNTQNNAVLTKGPDYYPSPDFIEERIFTYYTPVKRRKTPLSPKPAADHAGRYKERGEIREFDAQNILDAIHVGLIPNVRLELQILALFESLNIISENWVKKDFQIKKSKITADYKLADLVRQLSNNDKRFQETKGTSGNVRAVHSTFVEEGLESNGSVTGLSAQDMDFVIHNDKTINTAVILPVVKDMKQDVHAGFQVQHLPIPQRFDGNSATVSAPSFNLPPDIESLEQAKALIAEKFGVLPNMVIKLGESYYSHMGVTPQKIHPFAVANPQKFLDDVSSKFLPFSQLAMLGKFVSKDPHFMIAFSRSFRMFSDDIRVGMALDSALVVKEQFNIARPQWSLPLSYHNAPNTKAVEIQAPRAQSVSPKISAALPSAAPSLTATPPKAANDTTPASRPFSMASELRATHAPSPIVTPALTTARTTEKTNIAVQAAPVADIDEELETDEDTADIAASKPEPKEW